MPSDVNAVIDTVETVGGIVSDGQPVIDSAVSFLSFAVAMASNAFELFQQNTIWLVIIAGLVWVVDSYGLKYAPIPRGWIRYFIAFLIVMFFSWIWVEFFGGWIG